MSRKYFGTDGIRGRANSEPMSAQTVMRAGMAVGVALRRGDHHHSVVIGKDTRLSGYMIENALVAGFTAAGMDVFELGPAPTPAVAMLTRSLRADIGVMVSASHNPYCDNGVKFFGPDGYKLSQEGEARIESLMDDPELIAMMAPPERVGRATRIEGVRGRYVEHVKRTLARDVSLEGVRIAVDCANGAAYKVAPEALWELGGEVIAIGDKPDGFNVNQGCGSTDIAALQRKVNETRADIGIALDGDADRVIIVDEKGKEVDGDQIMAAICEYWRSASRLSGGGAVATIMSNLGLERFLKGIGLSLERTAVGDRHVVERMRSGGFNVGGEPSGHVVLSDFATTGDGLVAALQVLAAAVEAGKPVSEICGKFDPVPQARADVSFTRPAPLEAEEVRRAVEAARERLGGEGRLVVRESGTEPLIRIMAESDDAQLAQSVTDEIAGAISAAA